nr:hypothetical protein [Virus sp.]UCD55923.1 MAG: hypothetical protein [Solemoviridae sp.]
MARVVKDSADKATPQVECVGMKKQKSIGFIRKTDRVGLFSYSGSTVPGMSGAGYFYGNLLVGIHDGAQGSVNVGFSAGAVVQEMGMIFEAEASEDMLNIDSHTREGFKKMGWTNADVDKFCSRLWKDDDSWAQKISTASRIGRGESSKNVGIKIGKIGVTLPDDVIKTQATVEEVISLDGSNITAHSDSEQLVGAPSISVEEVEEEQPEVTDTMKLGSRFNTLAEKVDVLEKLVLEMLKAEEAREEEVAVREAELVETLEMRVLARLNDVKNAIKQELADKATNAKKCPGCGRICPSLASLRNHRRKQCAQSIPLNELKKGAVKKESAFVADRIKTVKEKPFLGKRPNSRIPKESPYYDTLSTREPSQSCRVSEESPCGTHEYQSGVSQDLRRRLERMVGRFSEVELN